MVVEGIKRLSALRLWSLKEGMRRPLAMDWFPDVAEVFRRVAEGAMLDCGVKPRADHCKHAGPSFQDSGESKRPARCS
jgi:hypothetical protein